MASEDSLKAELHRIREVLGKVHDPYERYQLTLLLETAARFFERPDVEAGPDAKGRKKCKPYISTRRH